MVANDPSYTSIAACQAGRKHAATSSGAHANGFANSLSFMMQRDRLGVQKHKQTITSPLPLLLLA